MDGYVQIYTGNGKGKTTASLGLTLRAHGAGLNVYIGQFLKKGNFSEIKALAKFENITIEQYGLAHFIKGTPSDEDIAAGVEGYKKLSNILKQNNHDVVIAEEANIAVLFNIITEKDLLALIDMKPKNVELVITGRGATKKVIEKADLVTEIKAIKHYYKQGVTARVGIEK